MALDFFCNVTNVKLLIKIKDNIERISYILKLNDHDLASSSFSWNRVMIVTNIAKMLIYIFYVDAFNNNIVIWFIYYTHDLTILVTAPRKRSRIIVLSFYWYPNRLSFGAQMQRFVCKSVGLRVGDCQPRWKMRRRRSVE